MSRFSRRVGLGIGAAAVLLLSSSGGTAQQGPAGQTVQESATATVIEIPVNVIGKDGKPVPALKAEDFELYDDGKKQAISSVEMIDLSRPAPDSSKPESIPASARRLWLLVFDLSYTSPSGLLRARDGARQFVTSAMPPNDLAAVGTLSVDRGWKLLVNFTRDRRQLGWAIDTLGLKAGSLPTADPLAFAFTPPDWDSRGGQSLTASGKGLSLDDIKDLQTIQKKSNDDYARGRVNHLMNSLAGIGRTLDSVRGRKHVLYFSEGFETRLLSGTVAGGGRNASLMQESNAPSVANSSPQDTANAAISGEIWKVDSDARFGSSSMRGQLTSLGLFNRSDAVLDAIDISGLRAEGDVSAGNPGSGTDALFALASATDGDLVRNANQLGGELQKLEERTALVYLLVYQPKQLAKPGAFHELKIKVRASGARVTARSGYYEPRPFKSLSPFERMLASGDLVTGGARQNEISGELLAVPFASNADLPQVPVLLEIPGSALLADDTGAQSAVQIYVYANDSSGSLADYVATEMSLDLAKLRSTLESGGIKFYGTLYLPVGDYAVRALVRNGTTGRSGVFSTRFKVPALPGGAPTLLPPLFQEAPGRWLMVRGNPRADAPPRPADYPFAVAGQSFIPSVVPTLPAGGEATVTLVAYNFPPSLKPTPLDVRAEVVGPDGRESPAEVTVSSRSDVERGGGRKLLLAFKPQGLSPGRYTLKVAVSDPVSKSHAESGGPFEVK